MTLWRGKTPLILASQSPARKMLLASAGIEFEVVPAGIDERGLQQAGGLSGPSDVAKLLAREKALAVSRLRPDRLVVGADQTLALGDRLFNKPKSRAQAADQLRALSGRTHQLNSAVAVTFGDKIMFEHVGLARLTMRRLDERDIAVYLDEAGESATSSVGAYQLERFGVHLFEGIEGDHFTILGLPLLPLLDFLRTQHQLAI